MIKNHNVILTIVAALLALDIALRLGLPAVESTANAQGASSTVRHPIALAAAATDNDNFLLYRMWSDDSIDVRLVNPMKTQAVDWPQYQSSPKTTTAGISFQDGWKLFQTGR